MTTTDLLTGVLIVLFSIGWALLHSTRFAFFVRGLWARTLDRLDRSH